LRENNEYDTIITVITTTFIIYMKNTDEKILIEAGLSEEQAAIYSALLDKGPLKVGSISSWTGIKRGLIYKVLDQLENIGLVSKKGGAGTVAVFAPEHPSHLRDMMERKEKSLALAKETVSFSLGALSSKFNLLSGKPNVQFYEGKEGVAMVIRDSLTSQTEILSFADNEAMNKYYPEINKENVEARKKSNIKKRLISIDTPYIRELAKNDVPAVTERRLIESNDKFAVITQIYDNKVSYITLDPDRTIGVIIEDKAIYKMQKMIFEKIWENAKLPY
jgi:sugar-specific transcriptional regulator TrmB